MNNRLHLSTGGGRVIICSSSKCTEEVGIYHRKQHSRVCVIYEKEICFMELSLQIMYVHCDICPREVFRGGTVLSNIVQGTQLAPTIKMETGQCLFWHFWSRYQHL